MRVHVRGHVRSHGSPRWEAAQVRGGRLHEAEVGGRTRPKWESKVGGRICQSVLSS